MRCDSGKSNVELVLEFFPPKLLFRFSPKISYRIRLEICVDGYDFGPKRPELASRSCVEKVGVGTFLASGREGASARKPENSRRIQRNISATATKQSHTCLPHPHPCVNTLAFRHGEPYSAAASLVDVCMMCGCGRSRGGGRGVLQVKRVSGCVA